VDGRAFRFLDPGELLDDDLRLVLARTNPGQPRKGWVPSYDFEMRCAAENDVVAGTVNFRAIDTESLRLYGGHFGYGVAEPFRGRRYAERSVRLLLPFAARHGYRSVIITCNPDNWPSRRTCERLGGELLGIVPLPPDNDMFLAGERFKCRYEIMLA
jgi:tagatose 1,6-diphosphate aldolase